MFFLKELPSRQMVERYADMFPNMDVDSVTDALAMMRRASLLTREVEACFASFRLSQIRYLILVVTDREPARDGLWVSELADRIDVSRPVMTRTLKSLEEDRLITVRPDEKDKRAKRVTLTDMGRTRLYEVMPTYFDVINSFMRENRP